MRIIQLLEVLSYGDGMGNHSILTHNLLKQAGFQIETYAGKISPNVPRGIAKPFSTDLEIKQDDIILLQFGTGGYVSECIGNFLCRKIMIYHNITPPQFFINYDSSAYNSTVHGYELIKRWAENRMFDAVLAFSKFNYSELISMGFQRENTFYFPGYLMSLNWCKKSPDKSILKKYCHSNINILFVGRISPNKKQEDIIRAFAYYQKHIDENANLIFVGGGEESLYGRMVKNYIKRLNVHNVIFPGHVSDAELIALYNCADVFVCMSEHEGFCIPLIEAMLFDVPILAYDSSAIPDTLGGAGVLLQEKDPVLVAKWIERIVNDEDLKGAIISEQRKRLDIFSQEKAGQFMLDFIHEFIKKHDICEGINSNAGEMTRIDDTLYNAIVKNLTPADRKKFLSRKEYLQLVHSDWKG